MTVIRELVTVFGVKFDKGSASKAEAQQKSFLQTAVKAAGFIIAAKKIGDFIIGVNTLASSVVENLNVMNQAFEGSTDYVRDWAENFGAAAYRNRYELEKMAAGMGIVLRPMLGGTPEDAAKMSTALAELTVDYASLLELKDLDVARAMKAGMVGEIEPLRRMGVVMTQDALNAFALSQGINKTTKVMNIAEKTQLRFDFLISKSGLVMGDAVRTADAYANALKGVIAGLGELATDLGLSVMPVMTRLMIWIRTAIWGFKDWVKNTEALKAIMIVLTGVLTALGIKLMLMFSGPLLIMAKFLLFFVLAVLIIDDFLVFLKGGKSVIGDFIDSIWGKGSAAEAVDNLKLAWEALKLAWKDMYSYMEKFSDKFLGIVGVLWQAVKINIMPMIDTFKLLWDVVKSFIDLFTSDSETKYKDFFNNLAKAGEKAMERIHKQIERLKGMWDSVKELFGYEVKRDRYGTDAKGNRVKMSSDEEEPKSHFAGTNPNRNVRYTSLLNLPRGAVNNTVNQNNKIIVQGDATPKATLEINKIVSKNLSKHIAAMNALTQRAPAR